MSDERKISDQIKQFQQLEEQNLNLEDKLEDLIFLLDKSDLDSQSIKNIKERLNTALDKKLSKKEAIEQIKTISLLDIDNLDKLDQLEVLLNNNYIDSKRSKKTIISEFVIKSVRLFIGFLIITLGFAMIIMPAPHSFEMFTIFWFSPDDGVTLMDLISLIIIAVGTYIVIKSYTKFNF